jgi:hypothetical protein
LPEPAAPEMKTLYPEIKYFQISGTELKLQQVTALLKKMKYSITAGIPEAQVSMKTVLTQ